MTLSVSELTESSGVKVEEFANKQVLKQDDKLLQTFIAV